MTAEDVLEFWFGAEPDVFRDIWFEQDRGFDAEIAERFGFTVQAGLDGALDEWAATPLGTLALVIVLDQFTRNIHRGSHLAFAGDAHARRFARNAVAGGVDALLTPMQRKFLYMPFQHAEDLADQDLSVRLFERLAAGQGGAPPFDAALDSALRHRDVIRRFGRFPHRNVALGRESTAAELAYIAEPGTAF